MSAERNSEVQEIPAKLRPFIILLCCISACSSVGPSGTRKGTAEPWRVFVQMHVQWRHAQAMLRLRGRVVHLFWKGLLLSSRHGLGIQASWIGPPRPRARGGGLCSQ